MLPPEILDIAAVAIGLGLLLSIFSGKWGSVTVGAGSVAVGVVLLSDLPQGWEIVGFGFFGLIILAGLWMISVGIKEHMG